MSETEIIAAQIDRTRAADRAGLGDCDAGRRARVGAVFQFRVPARRRIAVEAAAGSAATAIRSLHHSSSRRPKQQRPAENYSHAPPPEKRDTVPERNVLVLGDAMADWLAYGLEDASTRRPTWA